MLPVAERLKYLRERDKLTQDSLARALHINISTYKNYESGRRSVPSDVLAKIGRYYNVSLDFIVGTVDKPCAPDVMAEETVKRYFGLPEEDKMLVKERVDTLYLRNAKGAEKE